MNNQIIIDNLDGSEIAIIGMVCRFPGANNINEFWLNLRDGVESITFLTDEEIQPSGVDPAALNHPNYIKAAALIRDVDMFDASFFGITPSEAEIMDPQQRLFLECAWEALEQSGYDAGSYKNSIGVFAGARPNTYLYNLFSNRDAVAELSAFEIGLGNDLAFLASRVAYKLNLRGPSYSVHTACSTSLVAVHLACQSLLVDECQMALAGGVAINIPQNTGYLYRQGSIMSPDGHCRAFDVQAQGTIFGSGIGVVVLKRLQDAIEDGDRIYAIIKGSASNNDGSNKASFTAPAVNGQAQVVAEALANAGAEPDSITYIEAHGTGTPLGDPIEIRALSKIFQAGTKAKSFCAIGSVKTNLGHLDAAAGIASLIKTALALENKMLPPTLHFERPNPRIDFDNSPFYVNTRLSAWRSDGVPRRAGVSSFGVGGTNAHVILEEAPVLEPSGESRPWQLILLSAKTSSALEKYASNLANYLKNNDGVNLADVAYTLKIGRADFSHRFMFVCRDINGAVDALENMNSGSGITAYNDSDDRPVVYMFAGQGSQHINMAAQLYLLEPAFAHHLDLCSDLLAPLLNLDIRHILFPPPHLPPSAHLRLNLTQFTQPALFALQYSLAQLWISWGVRPVAFIGHSLGEYVAACLAGVFSLDVALRLVVSRAALMQSLQPGSMLAVAIDEEGLRQTLSPGLSVAAVNGPRQCVVSGAAADIEEYEREMAGRGITCHRLATSHAFHSHLMDPILDPFTGEVSKVSLEAPLIPYISNLTGTWITDSEATDPAYWTRHLRETVRFADGIKELAARPERVLLEVGPGQALSRLAGRREQGEVAQLVVASMPRFDGEESELASLLTAAGKLWLAGINVDWQAFYAHERRHRVPLPTYPFERKRYWIEPKELLDNRSSRSRKAGKNHNVDDWFYMPSWKRATSPTPPTPEELNREGLWLVFVDDYSLGPNIVKRARQSRKEVLVVTPGVKFASFSDGIYTIDPKRREDYDALFAEICAGDRAPEVILHLWGVNQNEDGESGIESLELSLNRGFYSLLYLTHALASRASRQSTHIIVIANGLHTVIGNEFTRPDKAMVLGPCKVIPQEFPNIACRSIDIVAQEPESEEESLLIDRLIAEIYEGSPDITVAYRPNSRWVQCYERVMLDREAKPIRPLREKGVYLITGGLGGVGLILAEHLARVAKARLVLIGRSSFPIREEWENWLSANNDENPTSRKIRRLQSFEEMGAEVLAISADVADEEQMRAVVKQTTLRFGEINGVIHGAGITSGPSVFNSITSTGRAECQMQFQPKVYGLYILEKVLQGTEPDFCIQLSSNAAVLGGLGLVAYSAANIFMDSFVINGRRRGRTFWVSSNWDHWPEETRRYTGVQTSVDQFTMTAAECVDAFGRIISLATEGQIVVSTGDLDDRLNLWINRGPSQNSRRRDEDASAPASPRPNLGSTYTAPRNDLEQTIAEIWQDLLGIEQVGVDDSFFDLGGHSLLAIQLGGKLQARFQMELPLGAFFESPTVAGVSQLVADLLAEQEDNKKTELLKLLASLSDEEVENEISKRANSPE